MSAAALNLPFPAEWLGVRVVPQRPQAFPRQAKRVRAPRQSAIAVAEIDAGPCRHGDVESVFNGDEQKIAESCRACGAIAGQFSCPICKGTSIGFRCDVGCDASEQKAKVLHPLKITESERKRWRYLAAGWDEGRPKVLADCQNENGLRPCPFASCKHHLYLDVHESVGSIKINFPGVSPEEFDRLADTCALDVARRTRESGHPLGLEEVGLRLNLTLERARQLEKSALEKVRESLDGLTENGRRLFLKLLMSLGDEISESDDHGSLRAYLAARRIE